MARRLTKRRWKFWLTIAVLALVITLDRAGFLLAPRLDDFGRYHDQHVLVMRVIDGDTIEVSMPDRLHGSPSTHVRLWGLDCPEVARGGVPGEPWSDEARVMARQLAEGSRVRLIIEPGRIRDSFSRILAHVELPDGRSLNRELLAAGLASADDRWPHARLLTYEQAEFFARAHEVGIWSKAGPPN